MTQSARVKGRSLDIRSAVFDDMPAIVALYADDELGSTREASASDPTYRNAFTAIEADPNHILAVAELDGNIVGTLLLSFLPGLSRNGAWRAQIEAMRVSSTLRGQGLGQQMLDWAVSEARARGCTLVQLTSDRRRPEAHRFYERAGFRPTHVGFKLDLNES